jgi:hypothetical protein
MRWDGVATRSMPSICMLPRIGRISLAGAVGADRRDRVAGDLASLQADRVGANVPDSMSDRICVWSTAANYDHGIRLVPICGAGGAILYEAESAVGDETDPRRPNATVRPRRTHPLAALKKRTGVIGFPSPGRGNQTFSSLTDGGTVASSLSILQRNVFY